MRFIKRKKVGEIKFTVCNIHEYKEQVDYVQLIDNIHDRNRLMLKILWGFFGVDITINMLVSNLHIISEIILVAFLPLLLITGLVVYKKYTKITMYLITLLFVGALVLLNLRSVDYINLIFLFLPPIFTMLYRDWKNIIISTILSLAAFSYFSIENGHLYFRDWADSDLLFFILFFLLFCTIVISESKINNNVRKQLMHELEEIKKLQQKLFLNEQRYRSMVKQSTEGIYAFDPESKKVVEASQRFCKMLGYREDEMIGKSLSEIVYHDLASINENIENVLKTNRYFVGQRKYKHQDGTILDVEVRATLIQAENDNIVLVNTRDISEKLKKDFELHLTKSVLDNTLDGALVTDLEGKIIYVNPSFERMTGYSPYEVLGHKAGMMKSGKHDKNFYDYLWGIVHEKGVWEGEFINRKKNGDIYIQRTQINVIFNENDEPILYSSVFSDITKEKQILKKLAENEQKYKTLFENNIGTSFIVDLNGHITDVNNNAEILTGYRKEELIGTTFIPLLCKDGLFETIKKIETIRQGYSLTFETKILHKDGNVVEINVIAVPLIIDMKMVGVIGIAQNITNQKQAERELLISEQRYKSLLNLYPEVVFVHSWDKIEFVNHKAVEFMGVTNINDIVGKSVFDFLHPDDRVKAAYRLMMRFQNENLVEKTSDYRFLKPDGSITIGEISGTIIEYNNEPALLGILRDVSVERLTAKVPQ